MNEGLLPMMTFLDEKNYGQLMLPLRVVPQNGRNHKLGKLTFDEW
jgi:hypothetical protein